MLFKKLNVIYIYFYIWSIQVFITYIRKVQIIFDYLLFLITSFIQMFI